MQIAVLEASSKVIIIRGLSHNTVLKTETRECRYKTCKRDCRRQRVKDDKA